MIDVFSIIVGIILALIATFCFSMGFVFQKKGLTQGLPELEFQSGIKNLIFSFLEFFKNKIWITGFLLGILGWVPYLIGVSLVGLLVVQPITSLGLLIFLVSSVKLLGERIRKTEIITAILLGIAPILIAFSAISRINFNLYDFLIPFLIFFGISTILALLFFFGSKLKEGTPLEGIFLTITGVIINAFGTIFTNIFTQAYSDANISLFSLFGWAEILFGIFWFDIYHIWVCISLYGMGIFFLLGVVFYQSGFQRAKASIVYLIINSLSIIIPLIVGIFVFNQSFEFPLLFLIAIGIILLGVFNLSKYQARIEKYPET
ncbi:MAG: hypothetical protein EU541_03775 [Promethearchaeota archaeon]|nr:MAG: hypothetical protein EU541_03775 [Candidatus Lokiarchaeota archaeon]